MKKVMKLMAILVAVAMIGSLVMVAGAADKVHVYTVNLEDGTPVVSFGFTADDRSELKVISAKIVADGLDSLAFEETEIRGPGSDDIEAFSKISTAQGIMTDFFAGGWVGVKHAEGTAFSSTKVVGFGDVTFKGELHVDYGLESGKETEIVEFEFTVNNEICICVFDCEDCDGCTVEDCECGFDCCDPCEGHEVEDECTCKECKKCEGCLVEDCECEDCPGACDCPPEVGVALAIIPTIVAAGAALVARKRK